MRHDISAPLRVVEQPHPLHGRKSRARGSLDRHVKRHREPRFEREFHCEWLASPDQEHRLVHVAGRAVLAADKSRGNHAIVVLAQRDAHESIFEVVLPPLVWQRQTLLQRSRAAVEMEQRALQRRLPVRPCLRRGRHGASHENAAVCQLDSKLAVVPRDVAESLLPLRIASAVRLEHVDVALHDGLVRVVLTVTDD